MVGERDRKERVHFGLVERDRVGKQNQRWDKKNKATISAPNYSDAADTIKEDAFLLF